MFHPLIRRVAAWTLLQAAILAAALWAYFAAANELDVAARAAGDNVLWGSAFSPNAFAYKLERARAMKPDIVIVGASSANQFRDVMFPGARTYNAASAPDNLPSVKAFLEELFAVHRPRLIVFPVAWVWFRPNLSPAEEAVPAREVGLRAQIATGAALAVEPRVISAVLSGDSRREVEPLYGRIAVGLMASVHGEGYRPDGSYQYGRHLSGQSDEGLSRLFRMGYEHDFAYYRNAVRTNSDRFHFVGLPDARVARQLEDIRATIRNAGAEVIFILPPFARPLVAAIEDGSPWKGFLAELDRMLAAAAAAGGAEYYNFLNMESFGGDDRHTIDALHPDEINVLSMVLKMAETGTILRRHIDVAALQTLAAQARDPAQRPNFHLVAR
jgi:hypothetical protein